MTESTLRMRGSATGDGVRIDRRHKDARSTSIFGQCADVLDRYTSLAVGDVHQHLDEWPNGLERQHGTGGEYDNWVNPPSNRPGDEINGLAAPQMLREAGEREPGNLSKRYAVVLQMYVELESKVVFEQEYR